jgi:hypothetical protein
MKNKNKKKDVINNGTAVDLSVLERVLLLNILPREGSIITLRMIRQLREKLSFDIDELKILQFRNPGEEYFIGGVKGIVPEGQLVWNRGTSFEIKNIQFDKIEVETIMNSLKIMDEQERMNDELLNIYDKFRI